MPSTMPQNHKSSIGYDILPEECPVCNFKISPAEVVSHFRPADQDRLYSELQIVFSCSYEKCNNLFIAKYTSVYGTIYTHNYSKSYPVIFKEKIFRSEIVDLSPNFIKIYNQAAAAELSELTEICGVGYRKSLEFLIKDYLIHLEPEKEEEIKSKLLGACISGISDHDIKSCAQRATWLGNDETHYIRKWEDKDLTDLKILIELTVNWITNKLLMERYLTEMQGR
ncbi:hypothetical protein ABGV40_14940 [Paenibacillus amylolyticus]|uniref:hypothetical protein n=1 Tax=Paenibacillus amylolyticus TaxID=1451 RepID=UPI003242B003